MKNLALMFIALGVLCWTPTLYAQAPPPAPETPQAAPIPAPPLPEPPAPGPERPGKAKKKPSEDPAMRRMMEDMMIARLSQELGLSDEQTVLLVRKFNQFRSDAANLRKQRAELTRELKALVEKDKEDSAIEAKTQELGALDLKIAQARLDAFKESSAGLAPWQRAKLYIFASEFENEVRGLVQKARERRHMLGEPEAAANKPGGKPAAESRGPGARKAGLRRLLDAPAAP